MPPFEPWDPGVELTAEALNAAFTAVQAQIVNSGTIELTGDATGLSVNGTLPVALALSGVTAGTYNSVTVDTKGRVTDGTSLVYSTDDFDVNSGTISLASTINTDHVFTGTNQFTELLEVGALVSDTSILALGTAAGFVAPLAATHTLGGKLTVSDNATPAQLIVGGVITFGTTAAVLNSDSITLNGATNGVVLNGPVGQVFMGPSNNALGGDWSMFGTMNAATLLEGGSPVLTDTTLVVGPGAFLTEDTINNNGTITQKPGTFAIPFSWGAGTVIAGTIELGWAPQDFVITKMIGNLGTAGGSYAVAATNNGTTITGLGSLVVNSTGTTVATASAGNTVVAGSPMKIIVSGITSTPTGGAIQVQGTYT